MSDDEDNEDDEDDDEGDEDDEGGVDAANLEPTPSGRGHCAKTHDVRMPHTQYFF